jgi:hypothetical protein
MRHQAVIAFSIRVAHVSRRTVHFPVFGKYSETASFVFAECGSDEPAGREIKHDTVRPGESPPRLVPSDRKLPKIMCASVIDLLFSKE